MSATLIRLIPENLQGSYVEVLAYTAGAWSFASAVLWSNENFSEDEIEHAKYFIEEHFAHASNRQKALVSFVQRIMLAKQYFKSKSPASLPMPSEWFDPENSTGFADTKTILSQVNAKRKVYNDYLQHLTIAAQYYLQYIKKPCEKVFNNCRSRLTKMKVRGTLQQFSNAILHYHYVKQ